MADLRIVDAPVLLQESITDDVKMPTGGLGNFSIRLGDIVWYVVTKEQLANKNYVDLSSKGVKDSLDEHIADKANPHNVTKVQVGLGNVDNTADVDKPISDATKSAIITATTDMATKTYVNSKDGDLTTLTTTDKTNLVKAINEVVNVKANKSTTLTGYGITDAYTKSEIDTGYSGVKTLYDKNVELGAGANGWTAQLIRDASGKNQQQINDEVVSIFRFGAICDGTLHKAQEWIDNGRFNSFAQLKNAYPSAVSVDDSIDTLAIEKALAKIGNSGHVRLGGTPVFSRKITLPPQANGIRIFANNIIRPKFINHDGGIAYVGQNENYGSIVFENIYLIGTNLFYPPAGYVPLNTGCGFDMRNAFDVTLINSSAFGFKKGYYLEHGFSNKTVGLCSFMFNQVGVEFVGMANANKFLNIKIRENRVAGLVIDGLAVVHPNYGAVYPTKNEFSGYIESNVPYLGGYLPPASDGSNSVGIKLNRTYENDFSGVYMENQEFDIILDGNSSYNNFTRNRHAPLGGRKAKIWFKGLGVNYNTFQNAHMVGDNQTDTHVISDHAEQYGNLFDNCVGFNIKDSEILGRIDFINNRRFNLNQSGTNFGAISRYKHGYLANPNASSGLTGIGTTSAALNVNGCGEVLFGTGVTAPTTITSITGVRAGQLLILKNYQPNHPVTIKASADGINGLVLSGKRDCVLANYSDSITFFVSGIGKIVEIGRTVQATAPVEQSVGTWTPVVKTSGGGTVATSSATGRWVKNGRQLTVWFDVTASSDLTDQNYYSITGMPNLPQFVQNGAGQVSSATNPANANQKDVFSLDASTAELKVRVSTQANFSNSDSFSGCATYIIA